MLLECPCFYGLRLRARGNIVGAAHDVERDDMVAILVAGYEAHKSLVLATAAASLGTPQQLMAAAAPEMRTCGQGGR